MSGRDPSPAAPPAYREALGAWTRVALLSFGGPAGQIAVMHRILVEEKRWIGEGQFLHALQFCMLLPGPEAQQLATYLGWLLHGARGGLTAGVLFVLPGFLAILALSLAYARLQGTRSLEVAFFGLKAAVVAVVVDALLRIGQRAIRGRPLLVVAVVAFVAMSLFRVPFAMIVAAAALGGLVIGQVGGLAPASAPDAAGGGSSPGSARGEPPSWRRSLAIAGAGLALWWLPVLGLLLAFGSEHTLVRMGVFFSKVAVLSFGGAYAVLAYVAEEAVHAFGWLAPHEMLDGLGLAETTPGPLIMVVQFVAFLGALRHPGTLDPTVAAVTASVVTTWVTFVPSFLWIFVGAPWVERLRELRSLTHALAAVTAAVVGVMAHLAVWFALHVWFGSVVEVRRGPVRFTAPVAESFDVVSLGIAAGALFLLRGLRWGLLRTLAAAVLAGAVWRLVRT